MEELPKLDRTWLCSVVFIDIVEYSVQSVAIQLAWKDRFNRYLGVGIQDVPTADRVILDTGDGAAVCFLGDPEAAMFCGLRLLGALVEEEPARESPMRARVGINLGPVKLVRDINGNLNAIGDGINVGQRVMSFASDDQILVSRSFYEVASCLSDNYLGLFRFMGVRLDKHQREHTVYELLPPGARQLARTSVAVGVASAPERAAALRQEVLDRIEAWLAEVIGPTAHVLVRQVSARATCLEELQAALQPYLPPGPERERFLATWEAELGVEGVEVELEEEPSPTRRDPEPPAPTPMPVTPPPGWDPAVLERARQALAIHLGPMARILVARAAARASGEEELYRLLAEAIASPRDREAFLQT
jgi:class 3 adenylate cyclase